MSGVIVDSSVWVDFFAGRPVPFLEEALSLGSVILPPLVVEELVSSVRRKREKEMIEDLVEKLPIHETPLAHWIRVGDLRRHLRSEGVSVSIRDAHVAQCALDRDAVLLTRDAVFASIARFSSLRVHSA